MSKFNAQFFFDSHRQTHTQISMHFYGNDITRRTFCLQPELLDQSGISNNFMCFLGGYNKVGIFSFIYCLMRLRGDAPHFYQHFFR